MTYTSEINPKDTSWSGEYPFKSNTFELSNGLTMHYLDEGPKEHAPSILMVHGNPTWSFYYRRLVSHFSGDYRCVAPDHIGCGLSEKPDREDYPYTLEERIANLTELVTSLDLQDITLVIHDWGGAIGMGLAANLPERIKRIVVFNTAAFRSDRIPFSIDICRIPGFGPLAVQGFNGFVRVAQIRAIHHKDRLKGPVGDGYVAPYNSWKNRIAVQRFVEDIPMDSDHPTYTTLKHVEDNLEQFQDRPMLIVWGERDFCFNPSFRREWERRFPRAEVHALKDASHYVLEDAHELIIPWMENFFTENPITHDQDDASSSN